MGWLAGADILGRLARTLALAAHAADILECSHASSRSSITVVKRPPLRSHTARSALAARITGWMGEYASISATRSAVPTHLMVSYG